MIVFSASSRSAARCSRNALSCGSPPRGSCDVRDLDDDLRVDGRAALALPLAEELLVTRARLVVAEAELVRMFQPAKVEKLAATVVGTVEKWTMLRRLRHQKTLRRRVRIIHRRSAQSACNSFVSPSP